MKVFLDGQEVVNIRINTPLKGMLRIMFDLKDGSVRIIEIPTK